MRKLFALVGFSAVVHHQVPVGVEFKSDSWKGKERKNI